MLPIINAEVYIHTDRQVEEFHQVQHKAITNRSGLSIKSEHKKETTNITIFS